MPPRQHRQHHYGDEARHACHCGLMFARRGDLRSHERLCPHIPTEEGGIRCHCGGYLHDWEGWVQHLNMSSKHWGEDVTAIVAAAAASAAPAGMPQSVNDDEKKQQEKERDEDVEGEEDEDDEDESPDLRDGENPSTRKHSAGWKRTCSCGRICQTMAHLNTHREKCFITPLGAGEHVCCGKRFINDNAWEKHKSTSAKHKAETQDPGSNDHLSAEKEGEKEVSGKSDPEAEYPRLPLSERNKRWSI